MICLIDHASEYANQVISGEILAGQNVINTCKRHLQDIEQQEKRGFYFDLDEANKALRFFEERLCLAGGEFEGKPFILNGWQKFIVCSIFGWKWKKNNYRRFSTVYVETGKGSGKSPLAAGDGS